MLKYNNRMLKYNDRWLNETMIPIVLPPNTVRLRYIDGVTPTAYHTFPGTTLTQISSIPNIWDITHVDPQYPTEWHDLLSGGAYGSVTYPYQGYGYGGGLLEIMAANVSNITNMTRLCTDCYDLVKVCDLNSSNVTDVKYMFSGCYNLTTVGSIDVSKTNDWWSLMQFMFSGCTKLTAIPNIKLPAYTIQNDGIIRDCSYMFNGCVNVASGILDFYNRITYIYYGSHRLIDNSTTYNCCFKDCGSNTVTGAAELAQIPSDWK